MRAKAKTSKDKQRQANQVAFSASSISSWFLIVHLLTNRQVNYITTYWVAFTSNKN